MSTTGFGIPWRQSYDALLHLQAVLADVKYSFSYDKTTPANPQNVGPPDPNQDPTAYLNWILTSCITAISTGLLHGRNSYARIGSLENRAHNLEKEQEKIVEEAGVQRREIARVESSSLEVLATLKNFEARQKNQQVYKNSSKISPLSAKTYDEHGQKWEPHPKFPNTLIQFLKLRRDSALVSEMLQYYEVSVYQEGSTSEATDLMIDNPYTVEQNMVGCLEELAQFFGMDLSKIGELLRAEFAGPV